MYRRHHAPTALRTPHAIFSTSQPHFTDTCTLPCAWPRPAVLGFRDGKQQLGHDNLTFWGCRARSAHRARPLWGRRGRPLYVVGGSSRRSINQLASCLFASIESLLCVTASTRSSTGSPREGTTSFPYMSGLHSVGACWPPHRWPIEPMGQAGNSRDIPVSHRKWAEDSGRLRTTDVSTHWPRGCPGGSRRHDIKTTHTCRTARRVSSRGVVWVLLRWWLHEPGGTDVSQPSCMARSSRPVAVRRPRANQEQGQGHLLRF